MASGSPFPPPESQFRPYDSSPATPTEESPWLAPASLAAQQDPRATQGASPQRGPLYDLRPLSTGEVLDRTFSLYRSRFLLFAGIAALAAAVRLVGSGIQLALQQHFLRHGNVTGLGVTVTLVNLLVTVLFLMAYSVSQAATVWAVGEVYLGRSATVLGSLRATGQGWLRYIGIALWQAFSGAWPAAAVGALLLGIYLANGRSMGGVLIPAVFFLLFLAAVVVGFILYVRNLFAVPVKVREGTTVQEAMRRSKVLSHGAKGKLVLVLLITLCLSFALAALLGIVIAVTMAASVPLMSRSGFSAGPLLIVGLVSLVVMFFGYSIITPVVMIGTTLLYYDQRVRREAYDVAVLLGDESGSGPHTVPVATLPAEPAPAAYSTAVSTLPVHEPGSSTAEPLLEPPTAPEPLHPLVEAAPEEPAGGASGL